MGWRVHAPTTMGFQLFACPECEYQNVYVFVRRDGGL